MRVGDRRGAGVAPGDCRDNKGNRRTRGTAWVEGTVGIAGLRDCGTAGLRDCETAGLRDCESYWDCWTGDCGTAGLRDYWTVRLRDYGTVGLRDCGTVRLRDCESYWESGDHRECCFTGSAGNLQFFCGHRSPYL